MKKLAIIGASYLQEPLIQKAKSMGVETHVFAWRVGDVGERIADFFYPISIVEKEEILKKCKEIHIDGICSIASDLAIITVNYVAEKMNLLGNSWEATMRSTNKHIMRETFERFGDPSPKSILVNNIEDLKNKEFDYPVIVKPTDRSGSRGITKLETPMGLKEAIEYAKSQGFEKQALVEEFVEGEEFSVECITWKKQHKFLAMTKKYTTGAPHFIEKGHLEPAPVGSKVLREVESIVYHALDSLLIENGASHTELKISQNGTIKIIEIGGRMGGDCIGSDLVEMSTGIDYVKAVIQIALGEVPDLEVKSKKTVAVVRYIFNQKDLEVFNLIKREHPNYLKKAIINSDISGEVSDSSSRFGMYLLQSDSYSNIESYLP